MTQQDVQSNFANRRGGDEQYGAHTKTGREFGTWRERLEKVETVKI